MSVSKRRTLLSQELEKKGVELRRDSILCRKFIKNNEYIYGNSVSDIVERMCQMHFLYAYTDYNTRKKKYILEARKAQGRYFLKRERILECCTRAETEILEEMGNDWPSEWPWLLEQ